jgi:hypothetical protein
MIVRVLPYLEGALVIQSRPYIDGQDADVLLLA